MNARFAALLVFFSTLVQAAEIRGRVVAVDGGEALARVQVAVLESGAQTVTGGDGSFLIGGLAGGRYTLRFNAVGYRLVTVPITLAPDETAKEFEITLVPDNFRRTEKVEVKGDIFHGPDSPDLSNRGWKQDGYVQDGTSLFNSRLHLVGSLRMDTAEQFPIHPVSPQLSVSLQLGPSTQLQLGVGRYNPFRFPGTPLANLDAGLCVPAFEVLQTANHYSAGLEHRLGEKTRIRALFFDREGDTSSAINPPDNCNPVLPHGDSPPSNTITRVACKSCCRTGPRIAFPAGLGTHSPMRARAT